MDLKETTKDATVAEKTLGAALETKVRSYNHLHSISEYLTKKVAVEWPGTFFEGSRWF